MPTGSAARPVSPRGFVQEARVAAALSHPHIIPIYDTGEIDGQLYLTMPVVDGTDVAELLDRRGPMSPERAVHIVDQLASALDTAHAALEMYATDVFVTRDGALVRAAGFPPHADRFAAHGIDLARVLEES